MSDEKKNHTIAASAIAAGTVTAAAVAKHNIDLNEQLKAIKANRVKKINDLQSRLRPGDVLVQGYSRKSSYNPFSKHIPVKNSDLIHSAYGNPYSHAAIYHGKGRVIHSGGSGDKVKHRGFKDFAKNTDVVAIRYGGPKLSETAINKARKQVGKPYYDRGETFTATLKEIVGLKTKTPKCLDRHTCVSVVNSSYPNKIRSVNEHPLEAVTRGKAKIIGYHKGFRGLSAMEQIPSRVIAPILRSAKFAIPVAAAAGGVAYAASHKKDNG